jgi:hypothetical protein
VNWFTIALIFSKKGAGSGPRRAILVHPAAVNSLLRQLRRLLFQYRGRRIEENVF